MESRQIPLVALAPTDWNGPWRNRQHILTRMARRGWRVLYSTGPISWWERGSTAWEKARLFDKFESSEAVSVYVEGRFPFRLPSQPRWDEWVMRRHARQLLRMVGRSPSIVCLYHPYLWRLAEMLNPRWLIYYAFDNYSKESGWSRAWADAQNAAVARADLVIATTAAIAAGISGNSRSTLRILPNGVDFNGVVDAETLSCPSNITAIPRPRICYSGIINRKIDFVLIEQIALCRPDWHWVFLGPVLGRRTEAGTRGYELQKAWRRCEGLSNVHFLGEMMPQEYMASLHHMDVNVICNRCDAGWWQDAYPLKFHEYLAAGRPVVSSPIGSLLPFDSVVEFAGGFEEWLAALERAIECGGIGSVAQRRAVAQANDWEDRVNSFEGWLRELLEPSAPSGKRESRYV